MSQMRNTSSVAKTHKGQQREFSKRAPQPTSFATNFVGFLICEKKICKFKKPDLFKLVYRM